MSKGFFISGTDTDVGKTLVSIGLSLSFDADYWKPIQSGEPNDSDYVKKILDPKKVLSSTYSFKEPLAPQQAAQKENVKIDIEKIKLPKSDFLIVEGVGGAFVPLNSKHTQLDLMTRFNLPTIVVARSGLGTLNHSLLTLEILKTRSIKVLALILSGKKHPLNKKELQQWCDVPILEIPEISIKNSKDILRDFKDLTENIKNLCD